MHFSNSPFSFWDQFNWIKVFPLFRTILDGSEISSNYPAQIKKTLLSNFVPRVPSFYIWTKSRLENHVTTVHLLQCKTNFIIRLCIVTRNTCFWERNLRKLKNIHLRKSLLISKKFFWYVYTSLDLFTLVYIRLDSSSHSSVFLEQIPWHKKRKLLVKTHKTHKHTAVPKTVNTSAWCRTWLQIVCIFVSATRRRKKIKIPLCLPAPVCEKV